MSRNSAAKEKNGTTPSHAMDIGARGGIVLVAGAIASTRSIVPRLRLEDARAGCPRDP